MSRVLVEASAGTGKTFRLEATVLELVAVRGVPLERILVMTFTRAAAAELRRRVRARLAAAADALAAEALVGGTGVAADPALAALIDAHGVDATLAATRLGQALERFDDASIDTIHGFARGALVRAALDAGFDAGASLVEDVGPLLVEAAVDLAAQELGGASVAMHDLLVGRHRIGRDRLVALARAVDGEPGLRVHPTGEDLGLDLDGEGPLDPERPIVPALERVLEARTAAVRRAWRDEGEALWAWLAAQHAAKRLEPGVHTRGKGRERHQRVRAWAEGDHPLDAATLDDLGHFAAGRLVAAAPVAIDPPFAVCAAIDDLDAVATAFLVHSAGRLRASVAARKRRRRELGFSDLLRDLDEALAGPDGTRLRDAVRARFDVALVDEFQDTDPVQWRILERLFPADDPTGRLELVGDPKQAIYAFRGADVETYLRARATVGGDAAVERLEGNWRSDAALIEALNALFLRADANVPGGAFDDPGIGYPPVVAARPGPRSRIHGGRPSDAPFQVHWVDRDAVEADDDEGDRARARALPSTWVEHHLPRVVAGTVAGLLTDGVELDDGDGAGRRALRAGDVAVLVRTNRQAEAVQRALAEAGIAAVLRSEASVLASLEAEELDRVLAAVVRPGSEPALRAMLATTLVGTSARDLVTIDEDALGRWHERVADWGRTWERDGVAALLQRVLAETGAPERLVRTARGDRALTNLRHLAELLSSAELAGRLGPQALHDRLRRHRADPDAASDDDELRLESDAACVQVVTVHAAKGLEYPVVLCPYLWHVRDRDIDGPLRVHDADGDLLLDVTVNAADPVRAAHARQRAVEDAREQARLLYVALTRARHRVIVHTGPIARADRSALHRLLAAADPGAPGGGPSGSVPDAGDAARAADGTDATGADVEAASAADDAWSTLAARLEPLAAHGVALVRVLPGPAPTVPPVAPGGPGRAAAPEARRAARAVDRRWRRVSFTSLVRGLDTVVLPADEAEGTDHDALAAAATVVEDAGPGVDLPLDDFPRGADAGEFLHRLLEAADLGALAAADTAAAAVDVALADVDARGGVGPRLRAWLDQPAPRARLVEGLHRAVTTPLGPLAAGRTLADLAPEDRLHEVRFDLPVAGSGSDGREPLPTPALADLLDRHAADDADPDLVRRLAARLRTAPSASRGLLTGSIDLVARVDGRYLIADFKSNRLGPVEGPARSGHYRRAGLTRAMEEHDYLLQELLYLVALHRWLRWRVPDHDFERDVAGGLYLFLRGMVGPDVGASGSDPAPPTGVWSHRPSAALVLGLDALLAGRGR